MKIEMQFVCQLLFFKKIISVKFEIFRKKTVKLQSVSLAIYYWEMA